MENNNRKISTLEQQNIKYKMTQEQYPRVKSRLNGSHSNILSTSYLQSPGTAKRPDVWQKRDTRPKLQYNPYAPTPPSKKSEERSSLSSIFLQNPPIRLSSKADGETPSINSKSIKDQLREYGYPLRGPIIFEMFTHYSYFLILLMVAFSSDWDSNIRFYMSVFYMICSLIVFQISRLVYAKRCNSVIPVYLSLPSFALLMIISRSVHMICMVMWYVSFLLVCLQSGSQQLQKHFMIYTVCFMFTYLSVVIGIMQNYYRHDCADVACGVELRIPIIWQQEIVLAVACLMVILSCMMLERFIRKNAKALLDRENFMRQLYLANVDLKRQLRQDSTKKEVDLEAPLTRATQILKFVKESADINETVQKELEIIITLLSSDELYSPNIYQKTTDSDVHGWLNDLLAPAENRVLSYSDIVKNTVPEIAIHFDFQEEAAVSDFDREIFQHLLQYSEVPSYDVNIAEQLSNGKSLYYFSWFLFRKLNFFQKFKIREEKFLHWISKIESGYIRENPYHNSVHATDVTHAMHYYITRKKIWVFLTPEEQIASIIAPIIHDYAHPGVNNAFLVSVMDPLAIKYSDLSVLEHFHTSSVFEMMQKDEFNFLENLTIDERKPIRETIISMVLATDMTYHFDWIGKFKTKMSGNGINLDQKTDRKLLLNMAIKCADVNNPSKPLEQSKRWTELVMEEFFRQGDREKQIGVPVSMFMSRGMTDIPKCQLGFIDYIVFPLFEAWQLFMGEDVAGHVENIQLNKAFWKSQSEGSSNGTSSVKRQTPTHTRGSSVDLKCNDGTISGKSSREHLPISPHNRGRSDSKPPTINRLPPRESLSAIIQPGSSQRRSITYQL